MENKQKYMIITVEEYPFGWNIKYFYLPIISNFMIGDVITSKDGKRYKVIDGITQVDYCDIDLNKYSLFE